MPLFEEGVDPAGADGNTWRSKFVVYSTIVAGQQQLVLGIARERAQQRRIAELVTPTVNQEGVSERAVSAPPPAAGPCCLWRCGVGTSHRSFR